MPPPLDEEKRWTILWRLLEGFPYAEVAAQARVSKSTVSGVWQQFAQGRMPGLEHLQEYADVLRQAAVELKKVGVSPGESALGLRAMQLLARMGVQPSQVQEYARLCERLAEDGIPAQEMIQAALELQRMERESGLDYQALVERTQELEKYCQDMNANVADLESQQNEVQGLRREEGELRHELDTLIGQRDNLRKDVAQREKREAQLTSRVGDLEGQAQAADDRLAAARRATGELAELGLLPEELPGFTSRLAGIAQRQNITSAELRERLFAELESLDEGLTLETVVEDRSQQVSRADAELNKLITEKGRIEKTISKLRREEQRLDASLSVLVRQASMRVQEAGKLVTEQVSHAGHQVQEAIGGLLEDALALSQKVSRVETSLQSYQWLNRLVALVEAKDDVQPREVRVLALSLFQTFHDWIGRHQELPQALSLQWGLEARIRDFQQWQV